MNIIEKMKEDHETEEAFSRSGDHDAQQLLRDLGPYLKDTWRGLEIGCGIGRLLKPLAHHFADLCGVDVSAEMIAQSKAWLKGLPHVETLETNGIDLRPLANQHFDFVYAYVAFQHMPKEVFQSYLGEVKRVLKPGGYLKFQIFVGTDYAPAFEDTVTLRIYGESDLKQRLVEAGFTLVRQTLRQQHQITGLECGDYFVLAQAQQSTTHPQEALIHTLKHQTCDNVPSAADITMSCATSA
jgi:cyclopropane fatty-acyl-phospholipid synthase-like methyltransferase